MQYICDYTALSTSGYGNSYAQIDYGKFPQMTIQSGVCALSSNRGADCWIVKPKTNDQKVTHGYGINV